MKVLGVDLSMTGTGVALLDDGEMLYSKTIKSKKDGDTPTDELRRLVKITEEVMVHVDEWDEIDVVVLEGIAFMAKSTALAQLSGLTYMVRAEIDKRNIPFLIVAPTTLKKFITGKGNSPKDIMMLETYKMYGESILDNNACDAYALAQVGLAVLGQTKKIPVYQKEVVKLINKQI